jgi:predicted HAD superfamily Cof-like phosphohydrolase
MSVTRKFHEAFGLDAPAYPEFPNPDLVRLRMRLVREEYLEVMAELGDLASNAMTDSPEAVIENLRRALKELCDLRYVVEGAAVSFGLDIDAAYAEVHRSNMSKLGANGKPLYREDGKVLKGPNYREADMSKFVPDITDVEFEEVHG